MKDEELIKSVTAKATVWLGNDYDEETRAEVKKMMENGGTKYATYAAISQGKPVYLFNLNNNS